VPDDFVPEEPEREDVKPFEEDDLDPDFPDVFPLEREPRNDEERDVELPPVIYL